MRSRKSERKSNDFYSFNDQAPAQSGQVSGPGARISYLGLHWTRHRPLGAIPTTTDLRWTRMVDGIRSSGLPPSNSPPRSRRKSTGTVDAKIRRIIFLRPPFVPSRPWCKPVGTANESTPPLRLEVVGRCMRGSMCLWNPLLGAASKKKPGFSIQNFLHPRVDHQTSYIIPLAVMSQDRLVSAHLQRTLSSAVTRPIADGPFQQTSHLQ